MNARSVAVLALFSVVSAALGAYVARHFLVSSALTRFLAAGSESQLASVALHVADSEQARTLVLGVRGPDVATSVAAAREWTAELARNPEVASIRSGPDAAFLEDAADLYFPRRLLFVSPHPEQDIPERVSDAGLRAAAVRLRAALAGPAGALVRLHAADDPLLVFPTWLQNLEAENAGAVRTSDGSFVAGDPPRAIVFLTTVHSAFDSARQQPLLDFVDRSFAALNTRHGGVLLLEKSGAHRFAVASERRARTDATWISAVSFAALTSCFLVVYRSFTVIALTFIPLGFGMLCATAAALFLFGNLNALTLAFGAAMIGICTDYPLHLVSHYALRAPGVDLRAAVRHIRTPIALAAGTTCAGFWAVAAADLPGVREMGLFAAIGVATAAGSTLLLIPELTPRSIGPTHAQLGLIALLRNTASARMRKISIVLALAAVAVTAIGLPRVSWDDDVFALNAPLEPEQVREDQSLRAAVAREDLGRLVVAIGADEEAALQLDAAVHDRLEGLRSTGAALDGFRSLQAFVWPRALQERNWAAFAAQPQLAERVDRVFAAEGFRANAFGGFSAALRGPAPEPLTLAQLAASPLRDLVLPFRVELGGGQIALLTFLRGLRDPAAVAAVLGDLPGAHFFDQKRVAQELYARYRLRSVRLIGAGAVAVVVFLWLRYRRLAFTFAAAAPALLGAALTLALLGLAGVPVSLLHLLGLLLVLSLGVDYGIFLVESLGTDTDEDASLLSVTLDCASTLMSFGLLAASSFPALRALGVSTGIGIAASLVFALGIRGFLAMPATLPGGER